MSIKSKVFAATATLTLVGGASAVGLLPAQASTPLCGSCVTVAGEEFGNGTPGFVLDVLRQGEKVGQPVILFRTSNTDPAEDFTILDSGPAYTYFATGLVSAVVDSQYGLDEAYEVEYSPYGVNSGLCVGVGSTAGNGTPVALEQCGVSSGTVWVVDNNTPANIYSPLINGSETNYSDPYVLHYPANAYPTDMPRPQLNTYSLQEYGTPTSPPAPASVYNNEMWAGLPALVAATPPTS